MRFKNLCLSLGLAVGGCTTPSTDVGDVTVATYQLHIAREGDTCTAGAMPRFVIKPIVGGDPTSIAVWAGTASGEGSTKFDAVFDSADGDFDADITCPSPMPSGAELFLDVETDGVLATVSIALK